jgi:Flp pilus assembly protein TadG
MPKPVNHACRGAYLVEFAGIMIVTFLIAAFGVDFGVYFAKQKQLETAAEAAALAATDRLWKENGTSPQSRQLSARLAAIDYAERNLPDSSISLNDVVFGMTNPATKRYDKNNFSQQTSDPKYTFTGGYNAVRVAAWRTDEAGHGETSALPTITARLFNVLGMDTVGYAVAFLDRDVTGFSGGLRPFYLCQGEFDMAMADGNLSNDTIRIYGNHIWINGQTNIANCPTQGSGNWGFADLSNGTADAVGNSTMENWIRDGYPGSVNAGSNYSTQSGNALGSSGVENALDTLIEDGTIITIPLYNQYFGSGSNTRVRVSSFAGFKITSYRTTGQAHQRYVEGHFVKTTCNSQCRSGNGNSTTGGGIAKIRLVGGA